MLTNGGIELGTWTRETHTGQEFGEIFVPTGWVAFWKEGLPVPHDPDNHEGYGRPEMHVIEKVPPFLDPPRIHSGEWALKYFTFYRIHDAGVYQTVNVTPGQQLRLSAWAHAWSSIDDDPYTSNTDGEGVYNFTFTVGIDPSGGTDPWGPDIVWGDGRHIYDEYSQIPAVTVTALRETVTVFVRSQVLWPFKHCDAYVDDIVLEVLSEPIAPGTVPYYNREKYPKRVLVAPQGCTLKRWLEIAEYAYNELSTLTGSADDALGHEPGQETTGIFYDLPRTEYADYLAFRDEHYPEATVEFVNEEPLPPPSDYNYPVVETGSKLHMHGIGEGGSYDILQYLMQHNYTLPYCKILATNPDQVGAVHNLKLLSPGTQFICRVMEVPGSGVNIEGPDFNSDPAVYMAALLPTMCAYPEVTYWELWNEQDPPTIAGHVQMAEFAVGCMQIAAQEGFRLAIPAYSMGVPEQDEWQAIWDDTVFFETARDGQHILSLHAYGQTTDPVGLEYILLRHRWLYNNILVSNNCVVPYIMTEYSIEESAPGVGITDWTTSDLMAEYGRYDAFLAEEYYCLGASVYKFGIGEDYNHNEIWMPFTDLLLSLSDRQNALPPNGTPPPAPPPEPELPIILFSQRDSLWSSIRLGASAWTMYNAGCAVTGAAMIGSVRDKTTDPGKLVTWLNANDGFTPTGLLYWAKPAEYYAGITFERYYTWRDVGEVADLDVIRAALSRGPAIVQVDYIQDTPVLDSHFVVMLREVDGDLEIADPWTGTTKWLSESYWRGSLASSIFALVDYRFVEAPLPEPVETLLGFNDHPGPNGTASDWLRGQAIEGLIVRPIFLGGNGAILDFSQAASAGQRVIVNLRYSWSTDRGGAGTLPLPGTPEWSQFVQAAIYTINNSIGVWGWSIGNEFNNPREFPLAGALSPLAVVQTYNAIRSSCLEQRLAPGALDPFNAQAGDPRNWLSEIYNSIIGADFVTAHGYIRGPDANLVGSTAKFTDDPLRWQYLNYPLCVTELLKSLPVIYHGLPVYITEFNHLWKTIEPDWGWVTDARAGEVVEQAYLAAQEHRFSGLPIYRWAGDEWELYNNRVVLDAVSRIA